MRTVKSRIAIIFLACSCAGLVPRNAAAQCDQWLHGPAPNRAQFNGPVLCQIVWDPDGAGPLLPRLVVGGSFTLAGTQPVNGIAQWDGTQWQPLGLGMSNGPQQATVHALGVLNGDLIAGGSFVSAGNVSASNIARWSVSTGAWQAMLGGSLGTNRVLALGLYNGSLYAGGDFFGCIARWDGTTWTTVGGGTDSGVHAFTVWGNMLVAGGLFTHAGGLAANRIAAWNGSSWASIGSGFDNLVECLSTFGGLLFAGGNFWQDSSGTRVLAGLARWDGASMGWNPPGSGLAACCGSLPEVTAMAVFSGGLYVAGSFDQAGGQPANNIAVWGGSSWQSPPGSPPGTSGGYSLGIHENRLIRTGDGVVLTWDDVFWSTVPGSMVRAMTTFRGSVVSAGDFSYVANGSIQNLAVWDGSSLTTLGSGLNEPVVALKSYVTGTGLTTRYHLAAGGEFTIAGGVTAYRIAEWVENPNAAFPPPAWSAVGNGFDGNVYAIERFNNQTYAGGDFTADASLSTALGRLAFFNGTNWVQPGAGLNGTCYALKVFNGQLYVGGSFTTAGGLSSGGLARWNGTSWSIVGGNFLGTVYSLEVHNGDLIIGGHYPGISGNPNIARYSTNGLYSTLGSGGTDGAVRALLSENGNLYVGGDFTHAGGALAEKLARWNGTAWGGVRGGANDSVLALTALNGEVHVGGSFTALDANTLTSPGWARYLETGAPWIARQPLAATVACDGGASFTVEPADGYSGLSYAWRRDGSALSNGPTGTGSAVTGATSASLSIANASAADQAIYDCTVSNSCGSAISSGAALTISGGTGDGDGNGDSVADGRDIQGFITMLITGVSQGRGICAYDMNADGVVDLTDVGGFVSKLFGP